MNSRDSNFVEPTPSLRLDQALPFGQALSLDLLSRSSFARSVSLALKRVAQGAGLVLSVEGRWGSGKTSVLAMVEEILNEESLDVRPVVVHFNPWLIGDREALLRQFLSRIAKAVKLADHAQSGKRVAKELKTYSKAFDVLKMIPGAEPWASMVKAVFESVGDATESITEYKTPDIEARKDAVAKALGNYSKKIVVLIDDIDRLFPEEVFEMVRIIKAVGDLPNVMYILAWDPLYVSVALEKLDVPFPASYLDKVVQVRLPIPPLSFSMRGKLLDKLLNELPPPAQTTYFQNGEDCLSMLFHNGLGEIIETPRDIVRLQDMVSTIEPGLRGEIHLADIIGLASLMIKAPSIYQLLHRIPQAFVGRRPGQQIEIEKRVEVVKKFNDDRKAALDVCSSPMAVQHMIQFLFPLVAASDGEHGYDSVVFNEGRLAHPERLLVALQLSMQPDNVSLVQVTQFLLQPEQRIVIIQGLQETNCIDFLNSLIDMLKGLDAEISVDAEELGVAIAQFGDSQVLANRAKNRNSVFERQSFRVVIEAIDMLSKNMNHLGVNNLVRRLISDPYALSVAAELARRSYGEDVSQEKYKLRVDGEDRIVLMKVFADNIERAIIDNSLFEKSAPDYILWVAALLMPGRCKDIFRYLIENDSTGDKFIEVYLRNSFDSFKGQLYGLPKEIKQIEAFVPLQELKEMAAQRLSDSSLRYPTKAAWRSVLEGGFIYGKDGTVARN